MYDFIIERLKQSKIATDPFEHLLIDNLLPEEDYAELAKQLDEIELDGITTQYDQRMYKPSKIIDSYPEFPKIQEFVNIIRDSFDEFYSILYSKFSKTRGVTKETRHVEKSNRFVHTCITKDKVAYNIPPHPDHHCNLFTLLFYTPRDDSNADHGLTLYKEIEGSDTGFPTLRKVNSVREVTRELIDLRPDIVSDKYSLAPAKHIDFLPNRLIIFAPADNTWHGVGMHRDQPKEITCTRNSFQIFHMIRDGSNSWGKEH